MLLPRKLFNQQQQQHCPPPPAAQTSKLQLQRSSNQLFICVFFSTLPRDYAAAATQRGRSFLVLLFLFGCFYQHNEGGRRIASLAAGWGCAQAVFSFWCVCGCGCGCGCLSVCAFFLFNLSKTKYIENKNPDEPEPEPKSRDRIPEIGKPRLGDPAVGLPSAFLLLLPPSPFCSPSPSASSFLLLPLHGTTRGLPPYFLVLNFSYPRLGFSSSSSSFSFFLSLFPILPAPPSAFSMLASQRYVS